MKKALFIIGLSLIATIGLSGCFGPFKKQQQEKQPASQTEDAKTSSSDEQSSSAKATEDKEESFFGSMQDLITRGKSLKCTYKVKESGNESEVVMYISNGNVRTEMEINTDEGETIESNMVIDKDWMYMWNSFTPNGTKMDMRKMPKGEDVTDSDVNKSTANLAKELDYKCRAWIPNNSKFKVPTDIQFNDITEIMAGMAEGIGDMTEYDIKEMENEANKFLCEHCKNAPTPELVAECLGDVVCD